MIFSIPIAPALTRVAIFILPLVITQAHGHQSEAQLPFERLHAHEEIELHIHAGWESRYFSEGRDALDGDSLWSGSVEIGWEHLAGGVWYGTSPEQSYDELQLSLALTQSVGDFEFYAAYTHFQFPSDDEHDNEVGVGVAWTGLPWEVELAADAYYSFEVDGYFAEASAARSFALTEQLELGLAAVFGINQGYVSDGHDGANHFALQVELAYALTETISLIAHTTYSWGMGSEAVLPGDAQLVDFFHAGVGMQWNF